MVILSETKMKRPLIQHVDIDSNEHKEIQIKSTAHAGGALVILLKQEIKMITADIVREEHGDDFVQAIVLNDRKDEKLMGVVQLPQH